MTALSTHLSMIILNVNGLNSIKRHGVTGWIKKQDPTTCCLQETQFSLKNKNKAQSEGMENE